MCYNINIKSDYIKDYIFRDKLMRFFVCIFSLIFGLFLFTGAYSHNIIINKKYNKACLLPGYKAQYENFYNGSGLGVSTRIAKATKKNGNYEIIYKLSVHKFIFTKIINRTSEGTIDKNGEVTPVTFKVIDDEKSNPKVFNIKKDQLDPLSYVTQIRISMLKGKKLTHIIEETLLGERKVTLTSSLKLKKEKINGNYINTIKVNYHDNKGNYGTLWLDPKKKYIPIKIIINTKKGRKRSGKHIKLQELLINYDPDISKYGCLYKKYKI